MVEMVWLICWGAAPNLSRNSGNGGNGGNPLGVMSELAATNLSGNNENPHTPLVEVPLFC